MRISNPDSKPLDWGLKDERKGEMKEESASLGALPLHPFLILMVQFKKFLFCKVGPQGTWHETEGKD